MYEGILIAVGIGLIWTFIGVVMSYCSRSKMDFLSYYVANTLFSTLLTLAVYARWDVIAGGGVTKPVALSACIIGSGIFSAVGLSVMQIAMKSGHNGVIWAIAQSALVIPFLCGVFLFGERGNAMRFAGVGMILVGMVLPSVLGKGRAEGGAGGRTWLKLTLAAFLVLGLGQTLQSVPSYWHGWLDTASLRPTLSCAGTFAGAVAFSAFLGRVPLPDRRTLVLALGMAALNTFSVRLFYIALDRLSASGMASLCFPLTVGACIVGFSVYSLLVLHEKSHWFNWFGLAATLAGIFSIALNDSTTIKGRNVMSNQKTIELRIDVNSPRGSIKRLHGTNLGPHLLNDLPNVRDYGDDLKALDIPLMRLHDAPLDNRGRLLVDIPMLFPLFHADPQDPRNYYFKQTDDYIEGCLGTGAKILYRLGVSIEHTKNKYLVTPPPDADKWAEICINVIRHYNEGWADGFHHGIEYWEIWNEADIGPKMWTGTWRQYIDFYVVTSKKIKQRFPNLKVGGPALARIRENEVVEFLTACREHQAPLDFFSWHSYASQPADAIGSPGMVRAILDRNGFAHTELNLNEWHYYPGDWAKMNTDREHLKWLAGEMVGPDSAAFIAAVLSGWQDTPLDSANHYVGTDLGAWGLFDYYGARNKCYYAIKAFSTITKYPDRIEAQADASNGVWILAGRRSSTEAAILISCFKNDSRKIQLKIDGAGLSSDSIKVFMLDASHDLEEISGFEISGSTMTIQKPEGSAVILIEMARLK